MIKKLVLVLLLINFAVAMDYAPETTFVDEAHFEENITYVDGGATEHTIDFDTVPVHGSAMISNYSDSEYEPIQILSPTSVTVGEVSVTNPKTWFYDYPVHASIPGCYDTMLEALNAACDGFEDESDACVSISPGKYTLATSWLINISNDETRRIIINGNGAELTFTTGDGIIINNQENYATHAILSIHNLELVGPGYAEGTSGIRFDTATVAVPNFVFESIHITDFGVGFNLSETVPASNVAPYGCVLKQCTARHTNVAYWIDGCHNYLESCIGDYSPDGSNTIGFHLDGETVSKGYHTLIACDGGSTDTGFFVDASYGGIVLISPFYDGSGSGTAINVSNSFRLPTTIINPNIGEAPIHIGDGGNYAGAHVYGLSGNDGYKIPFYLGDHCINTYIENIGSLYALNVTDNGAISAFYIGMYQGPTSTFVGNTRNIGSVQFNSDPDTSEAGLWIWDGVASHALGSLT